MKQNLKIKSEKILKKRPVSRLGQYSLLQEAKDLIFELIESIQYAEDNPSELVVLKKAHHNAIEWIAVLLEEKRNKKSMAPGHITEIDLDEKRILNLEDIFDKIVTYEDSKKDTFTLAAYVIEHYEKDLLTAYKTKCAEVDELKQIVCGAITGLSLGTIQLIEKLVNGF